MLCQRRHALVVLKLPLPARPPHVRLCPRFIAALTWHTTARRSYSAPGRRRRRRRRSAVPPPTPLPPPPPPPALAGKQPQPPGPRAPAPSSERDGAHRYHLRQGTHSERLAQRKRRAVLSDIAAQRSLPRGACHTADASSATTTSCTAATEAEAAATAADFTTRHLQQRRA